MYKKRLLIANQFVPQHQNISLLVVVLQLRHIALVFNLHQLIVIVLVSFVIIALIQIVIIVLIKIIVHNVK